MAGSGTCSAGDHSGAVEFARLLEALGQICQADGITLAEVRSIQFGDDEVSIHLRRANGCGRINTYPVAALRTPKVMGAIAIVPWPTPDQVLRTPTA
jgi:hypothetical protein